MVKNELFSYLKPLFSPEALGGQFLVCPCWNIETLIPFFPRDYILYTLYWTSFFDSAPYILEDCSRSGSLDIFCFLFILSFKIL